MEYISDVERVSKFFLGTLETIERELLNLNNKYEAKI